MNETGTGSNRTAQRPGQRTFLIVAAASLLPCLVFVALFFMAGRRDDARAWFDWPNVVSYQLRHAEWEELEGRLMPGASLRFVDGRPAQPLKGLIASTRLDPLAPRIYGSFPHSWTRLPGGDRVSLEFWAVLDELGHSAAYQLTAQLVKTEGQWKVGELIVH